MERTFSGQNPIWHYQRIAQYQDIRERLIVSNLRRRVRLEMIREKSGESWHSAAPRNAENYVHLPAILLRDSLVVLATIPIGVTKIFQSPTGDRPELKGCVRKFFPCDFSFFF
jgi:hypothetical protein